MAIIYADSSDLYHRNAGPIVPDFKIHTAGIELDSTDAPGHPRVSMIGSSTIRDTQRDTMLRSALDDMAQAPLNLSIWLNHDYDLPDKLFGSLAASPIVTMRGNIADLNLVVEPELSNPAAERTYQYIKNGRRLGCSVGCMIDAYEFDESQADEWGWAPIIIHHVTVVEFSVVGIPANQRCWVENGIRGVFARTLDAGLAPAVKSLFPRDYETIVAGVEDTEQRDSLLRIKGRPAPAQRVDWAPIKKSFTLRGIGGIERPLTDEETNALINEESMNEKKTAEEEKTPEAAPINDAPVTPQDAPEVPAPVEDKQTDVDTEIEATTAPESDAAPEEEAAVVEDASAIDPNILRSYNALGAALGLPEVQPDVVRSGAKVSKATMKSLGEIHKQLMGIAGKMICEFTPDNSDDQDDVDEGSNTAAAHVQTQKGLVTAADLQRSVAAVENTNALLGDLTRALAGIDIKSLEASVAAAHTRIAGITGEVAAAENTLKSIHSEVAALTNLPLGKPNELKRSIKPVEGTATYQDMLAAAGAGPDGESNITLEAALALTTIETVKSGGFERKYRRWPAGVGGSVDKGVRPALTHDEMTFMRLDEWDAYATGAEALVPLIRD